MSKDDSSGVIVFALFLLLASICASLIITNFLINQMIDRQNERFAICNHAILADDAVSTQDEVQFIVVDNQDYAQESDLQATDHSLNQLHRLMGCYFDNTQ